MSCCGVNSQALFDALPDVVPTTIANDLLFRAPMVFDEEIEVQNAKATSEFLRLFNSREFPLDQDVYTQLRITRSSGIQYYDNNAMFRKAHDESGCTPGCTWDPRSFRAGRETVSSSMLVCDFEQELPCHDNMYKKYSFVEFFMQIPEMLSGYMEDFQAQYVRNELLHRAKKTFFTAAQIRTSCNDPYSWPNLAGIENLMGDLTPDVLLSLYDEMTCNYPGVTGFGSNSSYPMFFLMMDPLQWRLKTQKSEPYASYIERNPSLSEMYMDRFMPKSSFADMFSIIPTKELPRADIVNGQVVYHHRYLDVPAEGGGVKMQGNPGYASAEYGIALVLNADLGWTWDEMPIPLSQIGDYKVGPQYGQVNLQNGKFSFLNAYDYECNPLGKGGKWISQYKTGFHPGPGIEALHAILYPLTKYEHLKSQLEVGPCFVAQPVCTDTFVEGSCPCPQIKACCNLTSTKVAFKTDTDIGAAVGATIMLRLTTGETVNVTVGTVDMEGPIFVYTVTSADGTTAIPCACIQDLVCDTQVVCQSRVLATSDCQHTTDQWGVQLDSCFTAAVGALVDVTFANGDVTAGVAVTSISTVEQNGLAATYHFLPIAYADVCAKGGVVLVKLPAGTAGCENIDVTVTACA